MGQDEGTVQEMQDIQEIQDIQEAYVVPTKQIPPPRGARPIGGVAGRYERRLAAKRLMSQAGGEGLQDAVLAAAIAQKAEAEGRRRQIDIQELARIAESAV